MDWSWFSTPLGLAIIASSGAFVGALLGVGISSWTTRATHREKLKADSELAERKVNADIALAERKLALDRALADWKRRTEFAEQVLADFYRPRDIFEQARTYFAFAGEGSTRTPEAGETEDEIRHRNAIYAPYERLTRERDFLTEMSARRFRFMALFGQEAGQPFLTFIQTSNRIGVATRALVHDRDHLRSDQREEFEMLIGWTAEETDPVRLTLNEAVERVEIVCKPVLEARPT